MSLPWSTPRKQCFSPAEGTGDAPGCKSALLPVPFFPSKGCSLFRACWKAGCSQHFPLPLVYFYSNAVLSCRRIIESLKPGCSHPCSLLFPVLCQGWLGVPAEPQHLPGNTHTLLKGAAALASTSPDVHKSLSTTQLPCWEVGWQWVSVV